MAYWLNSTQIRNFKFNLIYYNKPYFIPTCEVAEGPWNVLRATKYKFILIESLNKKTTGRVSQMVNVERLEAPLRFNLLGS